MSDEPVGQVPTSAGEEPRSGLDDLTDEVLPALVARLRASRLGELEVRTDGWRVRLRRDGSPTASRSSGGGPGSDAQSDDLALSGAVARSPGVGYFTPAPELAIGYSVKAGDLLGSIDVLGIGQDVSAPTDGVISHVLVEDGQAVEYGQALAHIDPLEVEFEPGGTATGNGARVVD